MKVVVAGSRGFIDYKFLKKKLIVNLKQYSKEEIEIVSGGANGADKLGEKFAKEYGLKLKRFIPDWDKHGKSAGYIRNAEMAEYSDICFCFWDGSSKGTKHMIDLALKNKLETHVYIQE